MIECGLYRVIGKRAFRGHEEGEEFPARLDPNQERRATMRGSIVRLGTVDPTPEHFSFPEGWLSGPTDHQSTEAPQGASLVRREQ